MVIDNQYFNDQHIVHFYYDLQVQALYIKMLNIEYQEVDCSRDEYNKLLERQKHI